MEGKFNIFEYKKYCDNYKTEQINEIAVKISKLDRNEIENNLLDNLFQNDENMNVLIMKILIFSGSWGLKSLFNFFESKKIIKLRKHYYNVIGKYVAQNIDDDWKIVKQYVYSNSQNIKYAITRIFYYLSKCDSNILKQYLSLDDVLSIYHNEELCSKYNMKKIDDSPYLSNQDEFKISLNKILEKLVKNKLKNNDYLDKYYNEVFTEDSYMENIFHRIRIEKDILSNYRRDRYCIFTEYGNNILGNKILELEESFKRLSYKQTINEYIKWLDRYTNLIYDTILEYGEDNYEKMFYLENVLYGGWAGELIFRCHISNKITEDKALKIINKLIKNNYKRMSIVEANVFRNLLQYLNIETTAIFKNRLEKCQYSDNSLDSELTVGNNSFHFLMGICERYYGTYEMARFAYTSRRQISGQYWEQIVGEILPLIFYKKEIKKHPILENNLIPDYMIYEQNSEKNLIIECKLTLGFRELEETLEKYSKYSRNIYFFCFKNRFENEDYHTKEYIELKKKYNNNIEIFDYNRIKDYVHFDNKEEFKNATNKITQKNVLKNDVILDKRLTSKEKELIITVLESSWGKSTLFKGSSNIMIEGEN